MTSDCCNHIAVVVFHSLHGKARQLVPLVVARNAFSVVDMPGAEVVLDALDSRTLSTVVVLHLASESHTHKVADFKSNCSPQPDRRVKTHFTPVKTHLQTEEIH